MLRYWQSSGTPASPAPRYVVLCAFHRFEVWEPGAVYTEPRATFDLVELPDHLDALLFLAGGRPVFMHDQTEVTREAVSLVTSVYGMLRERRAADRDVLRDFVLQSVWAMFAEDLAMLPSHLFTRVLDGLLADPRALEPGRPGSALRIPERAPRQAERGSLRGYAVRERLAVRAARARARRARGARAIAAGLRVELAQSGARDLRSAPAGRARK